MLGGPSVAPLMTCLVQPVYIGLFLGTVKLSWAPSGRRTQSEGETLELLLTTHFSKSEVIKESVAPAATLLA
jgi:hypothetical protein